MSTTSATYRCDRCGVTQEHERGPGSEYKPEGWNDARIPRGNSTYTHYLDLCPKCVESINRWVNRPDGAQDSQASTPSSPPTVAQRFPLPSDWPVIVFCVLAIIGIGLLFGFAK